LRKFWPTTATEERKKGRNKEMRRKGEKDGGEGERVGGRKG